MRRGVSGDAVCAWGECGTGGCLDGMLVEAGVHMCVLRALLVVCDGLLLWLL
jgi:hypothetical protein